MNKYAKYFFLLLLLVQTGIFAQPVLPPPGNPRFTQQELDQMLAPIALYQDPLLSQILMAATYPLEIVEAARWATANASLTGDAAVRAAGGQNWDASVKSLVAFPQVLQTLDQNIEWTERLGDAFLAQQAQVMDTVQTLRERAQKAGNLNSNAQIQVTQSDGNIEMEAANPDVVYVPYYDPTVVYGSWWWPEYPPMYWAPWPNYAWYGGFAWGVGIGIGADFFFGLWDWRNHYVYARNPGYADGRHAWQHDPVHRRGVPYRDATLNRQFGRATAAPESRTQYRGYVPPENFHSDGSLYHLQPQSGGNTREPQMRATMAPRSASQPYVEPRAHALENVGRGADVRNFSARGNASFSGRGAAISSGSRRR